MKKVLKAIVKTVKLIFIVFCLFLGSLFFRQQRLPGKWVGGICERMSSDRLVFSCDSASFGFGDGLHFENFRAYDRLRRDNLQPLFSSASLSVWFIPRRVRVVAAKFPRLHDGYYEPVTEESYRASRQAPAFDFGSVELPDLAPFTLELVRPEILGVAPERVVSEVLVAPKRVDFSDIRLDWPDQDVKMWLDGNCTVDFKGRKVDGYVRGTARQEHIRPLLVALDLPVSYGYMGGYPDTGADGFTEVVGAVPSYCGWAVDLSTGEFNLDLELHPTMGRYNNVRLKRVDGKLGFHVYFTDDYMGYDVKVGPLTAVDLQGRLFGGEMTVHGTNGLDYLEFDAHSELEKQDTLDIIGYLNRGTLDSITCNEPPRVTAKGIFNCNDVNIPNNDLGGVIECASGEFLGQSFSNLKLDYRIKGSEISFNEIVANGVTGGEVRGSAVFHLPIADGDEEFFGRGKVCIENGKLVRIPLFSVLTTALADNVPGIDKLVNQSEAKCDFTVSNGVFRTDNLVVQGALFCLRLKGSCNLVTDDLEFVAHCTVMKDESTLGRYLIQPVLWPFTKLFTEFEVTGKSNDPKLRNTSVKGLAEKASAITEQAGKIGEKAGNMIKEVFIR